MLWDRLVLGARQGDSRYELLPSRAEQILMIGLRAFIFFGGLAFGTLAAFRGDWRAAIGTTVLCVGAASLFGKLKEAVWLNADRLTAPGRPIIRMRYQDISGIGNESTQVIRIIGRARYLFWKPRQACSFRVADPESFLAELRHRIDDRLGPEATKALFES